MDPIAGECDRLAIAPGGENAIAGFTLPCDPRHKLFRTREMWPQLRHHRETGGDLRVGLRLSQDNVAHAAVLTGRSACASLSRYP